MLDADRLKSLIMLDADRLKSLLLRPDLTTPEDTECIDLIRKCPEITLRIVQALLQDRTVLEETYRTQLTAEIALSENVIDLKSRLATNHKTVQTLKTDLEKAQREVKRLHRTVLGMAVKMFGKQES